MRKKIWPLLLTLCLLPCLSLAADAVFYDVGEGITEDTLEFRVEQARLQEKGGVSVDLYIGNPTEEPVTLEMDDFVLLDLNALATYADEALNARGEGGWKREDGPLTVPPRSECTLRWLFEPEQYAERYLFTYATKTKSRYAACRLAFPASGVLGDAADAPQQTAPVQTAPVQTAPAQTAPPEQASSPAQGARTPRLIQVTEEQDCAACLGRGTCFVCKGTKKTPGLRVGETRTCSHCSGTGRCPACGGTGKITTSHWEAE